MQRRGDHIEPGERYSMQADLDPNAFELVVLEPVTSSGQ